MPPKVLRKCLLSLTNLPYLIESRINYLLLPTSKQSRRELLNLNSNLKFNFYFQISPYIFHALNFHELRSSQKFITVKISTFTVHTYYASQYAHSIDIHKRHTTYVHSLSGDDFKLPNLNNAIRVSLLLFVKQLHFCQIKVTPTTITNRFMKYLIHQ